MKFRVWCRQTAIVRAVCVMAGDVACCNGGPGSIAGQSRWDLWCTEWFSTFLKTSVLSVSINSPILHPYLRPKNLSSERQVGEVYGRWNKEMPSRTSGNIADKMNFTLLVFRRLITFACNNLNGVLFFYSVLLPRILIHDISKQEILSSGMWIENLPTFRQKDLPTSSRWGVWTLKTRQS